MPAACSALTIDLNSPDLRAGLLAGHVALLGGEVAERAVPPVVSQRLVLEKAVVGELVDRQQLHRRDAQALQVLDDRRVRQARRRFRAAPRGPPGAASRCRARASRR